MERIGWLCPRCGVSNSPDVLRCECQAEWAEDDESDDDGIRVLTPAELADMELLPDKPLDRPADVLKALVRAGEDATRQTVKRRPKR